MLFRIAPLLLLIAPAFIHSDPAWVAGTGEIPESAVFVGRENDYSYYVCRGDYEGGTHPGKLHAGKCNIEFNYGEIILDNYEVLIEDAEHIRWVPDSSGFVPADAYPVGYENGSTLFSCAAEVVQKDAEGLITATLGTHAGKVISSNCNIPYGGGAYQTDHYAVLVILTPTAIRRPARPALAGGAPGVTGRFDLNGRRQAWKKAAAAGAAPYPISR